jgi:hypothetical protein
MANKTATLYINVKQADGKWKFLRPVNKGNGRLKAGWALVDETPTEFAAFNLWLAKTPSVRAGNAKISSACRHSLPEKRIEATIQ